MITIKKRSELKGAEKFGSCASCGCRTDEKEIDDENDCKSFLLHSCCKRKLS